MSHLKSALCGLGDRIYILYREQKYQRLLQSYIRCKCNRIDRPRENEIVFKRGRDDRPEEIETSLCSKLFWFGTEDESHCLFALDHYHRWRNLPQISTPAIMAGRNRRFVGHLRRYIADVDFEAGVLITFDKLDVHDDTMEIMSGRPAINLDPVEVIYCVSVWDAMDGVPLAHAEIQPSRLSESIRSRLNHNDGTYGAGAEPGVRLSDWYYWPATPSSPEFIRTGTAPVHPIVDTLLGLGNDDGLGGRQSLKAMFAGSAL